MERWIYLSYLDLVQLHREEEAVLEDGNHGDQEEELDNSA